MLSPLTVPLMLIELAAPAWPRPPGVFSTVCVARLIAPPLTMPLIVIELVPVTIKSSMAGAGGFGSHLSPVPPPHRFTVPAFFPLLASARSDPLMVMVGALREMLPELSFEGPVSADAPEATFRVLISYPKSTVMLLEAVIETFVPPV